MPSFFGRFTPRDDTKYNLQILEEFFSKFTHKYVISYEQKPRNNHYHFCIWDVDRSPENLRYHIKLSLEGHVYLSGKEIENKVNAIAYTIKDGSYKSAGIDIFTWMEAVRTSKPKKDFNEEYKKLVEHYDPNLHSERWLVGGLLELHKEFNKKIYINHIRALKDLIFLKKQPNYREKLIDKIIGYD